MEDQNPNLLQTTSQKSDEKEHFYRQNKILTLPTSDQSMKNGKDSIDSSTIDNSLPQITSLKTDFSLQNYNMNKTKSTQDLKNNASMSFRDKKYQLVEPFKGENSNLIDSINYSIYKFSTPRNNLYSGMNEKDRQIKFLLLQKLQMEQGLGQAETQQDEDKETKKLFKKMQDTFCNVPKDKNPMDLVQEGAVQQYYQHYKNLDKVIQENKFHNIPNSIVTTILHQQEKNLLLPSKLGLIHENENDPIRQKLRLEYGDKYMKVLGKGLNSISHLKEISLEKNRISSKSSKVLLSQLNPNTIDLNLTDNKIGNIGAINLYKFLSTRMCKIQYLNLDENFLGVTNVIKILEALNQNYSLQVLNLSKNCLTEEIAEPLKNFVQKNQLNELYLHWNILKPQFGKILFPCLSTNESLKVLDLSNNSLGVNPLQNQAIGEKPLSYAQILAETCIVEICEFFEKNIFLIHLDMSYNSFNYEDTQQLALSLEKNKTIYGIHFKGNSGFVDHRQFIVPEKIPLEFSVQHKRIKSANFIGRTVRDTRDNSLRDCCWICENWIEHKFVWDAKTSGKDHKIDPLFISFNFENFHPQYYGKPHGGDRHMTYHRVLPQGETYYYFSNSDDQFMAKDHNIVHNTIIYDKVPDYQYNMLDYTLKNIHKVVLQEAKPRTRDPVYIPPKMKKKKVKWSLPISLFSKWRQDDAELINLCFEYDWDCGKVTKVIKDPEQLVQVKEFFRARYKLIKDTYKYYASKNPVSDIWAIQNISFLDMIEKIKILDSKVTMEFLNIKWTSVIAGMKGALMNSAQSIFSTAEKKEELQNIKSFQVDLKLLITAEEPQTPSNPNELFFLSDKKLSFQNSMKHINHLFTIPVDSGSLQGGRNPRNVEKGINRYQLMELIVRIAEEKYINKYQKAKNMYEAVQMLWDEHLLTECSTFKYDSQNFRNERYWNEQCDYVLKHYKRIIDHIYTQNAKKKVKPGQQAFMCLDELNFIVTASGLSELEWFGSNVYLFAFNQSMMTQVDELGSDRIFQMSQVEYYEALARIAEEASLPPLPGVYEEYEVMTLEQKQKMPLGHKLEGLIIKLFETICDANYRANYGKIERSFFWQDPDESDFDMVDAI